MNLRYVTSLDNYFRPTPMTYRKLPTYLDIYKHVLSLKPCSDASAKSETVNRILDIWYRASLPTFNKSYVTTKLSTYLKKVLLLKKSRSKTNFDVLYQKHKSKYDTIFDICACQCNQICRCSREKRIPPAELEFLVDQNISNQKHRSFYTRIYFYPESFLK